MEMLFFVGMWVLWCCRNKLIFEQYQASKDDTLAMIHAMLNTIQSAYKIEMESLVSLLKPRLLAFVPYLLLEVGFQKYPLCLSLTYGCPIHPK